MTPTEKMKARLALYRFLCRHHSSVWAHKISFDAQRGDEEAIRWCNLLNIDAMAILAGKRLVEFSSVPLKWHFEYFGTVFVKTSIRKAFNLSLNETADFQPGASCFIL